MADRLRSYASIALMAAGVVGLTVGADLAPGATAGGALAAGGGLTVILGGIWGFRTEERRGEHDERYFQITLRAAAFSLWAFYWAVAGWSQFADATDLSTPVLDPMTWLLFVPWVVFAASYWYYTRRM